jgi:alpha-N-acetylglucosaminidase
MKKLLVLILIFVNGNSSYAQLNHQAAKALVKRLIPYDYQLFAIEHIDREDGKDVFELESKNEKIILRGNNTVSVASALNHYIKYYCNMEYSWDDMSPLAPDKFPVIPSKIRKVSPYKYRYYLNYVTFNYSTAWWDWKRWEKELDWMALNGINMPLAVMGQDAIWQRVYKVMGFTDEELNSFFSGPAYSAFNWMGLLDGWNGPLPQSWIDSHEQLQKKILKRARSFGMTPVLPAFTGHVPPAFKAKFPDAKLQQVQWAVFPKVDILDPADPMFVTIGERFINEQKKTFGTDHLYSADPFIEVMPPSSDSVFIDSMIQTIYNSMAKADPEAVWVMQGWMFYFMEEFWQSTQTKALLNAVNNSQLIMLDLWSDNRLLWKKTEAYEGKPWIWCMINNFGGRNSLHGKVDILSSAPAKTINNPSSGNLKGIGLTMEAIENNAAMFEIMLENTWTDQPIDVDQWICRYVERRYESKNQNVQQAWKILRNTVYNYQGDLITCGPKSVITEIPSIEKVSKKNSADSFYQPADLLPAWKLMLNASDQLENNTSYQYDLVDLTRQILANYSNELQEEYRMAFRTGSLQHHRQIRKKFLELIDDMNQLMGSRKEFLLGKWIEDARRWGTTTEEKNLYEQNARNLLTLWHGQESDRLQDYAARQWSGLLSGFYQVRWIKFFNYAEECLQNSTEPDMVAFGKELREWEWKWVQGNEPYRNKPVGHPVEISKSMYHKYSKLMKKAFSEKK